MQCAWVYCLQYKVKHSNYDKTDTKYYWISKEKTSNWKESIFYGEQSIWSGLGRETKKWDTENEKRITYLFMPSTYKVCTPLQFPSNNQIKE